MLFQIIVVFSADQILVLRGQLCQMLGNNARSFEAQLVRNFLLRLAVHAQLHDLPVGVGQAVFELFDLCPG